MSFWSPLWRQRQTLLKLELLSQSQYRVSWCVPERIPNGRIFNRLYSLTSWHFCCNTYYICTCCNQSAAPLLNVVSVDAIAKKIGNKNFQRTSSNWSSFMKTFFFTTEINLSNDIPNNDPKVENSVKINSIPK